MHNITNLKICYYRQLANLESIVEEVVGVKRKIVQLITKVILIFEHHICTSFRISIIYYDREKNKLAGSR